MIALRRSPTITYGKFRRANTGSSTTLNATSNDPFGDASSIPTQV